MKKLLKIFFSLIGIIVVLILAFPFLMQVYLWGLVQIVGTSYERHVERIDEENVEQANIAIQNFANELSGRQNSISIKEREIQLPDAYKSQSQIVSKFITQIQNNDEDAIQFASLKAFPFLLRHNDLDNDPAPKNRSIY